MIARLARRVLLAISPAKPMKERARRAAAVLIAALHQVSQRELPLRLAGAGLPQLPALTGAAKSYAERLFRFPTIDRFPDPAARDAL